MAFNSFRDLITRTQATFGTNQTYTAEPQIKTYWIFVFYVPDGINQIAQNLGLTQFIDTVDGKSILTATVTDVEVPAPSIQTARKPGLAGTGVNVPTAMEPVTTTTITFRDYFGFVVTRYLTAWAYAIRNPFHGLSILQSPLQSAYKGYGDLIYFDATGSQVLLGIRFYGLFPTKPPLDSANASLENNEVATVSATFSVDAVALVPEVENGLKDILQSYVEKTKSVKTTVGTSG